MVDSALNLSVLGVGGRMGQELVRVIADRTDVRLVGAFCRSGHFLVGQDAGIAVGARPLGLKITDNLEHAYEGADAILDFTSPGGTKEFLRLTIAQHLVHIIGTTGFSESDYGLIKEAGKKTTIVCSGNMSIGANLLGALGRLAAKSLGPDFDIRIVDIHHRHKVDSPSGTALLLKNIIAPEAHGVDIPIASLRCGTVVGEHTILFSGPGERISLIHTAEQRSIFAAGALRAAIWACEQKSQGHMHGFYTMTDVLGLKDI